ncbi:MAG: PEP/pyruvate-binding domain-containing protein [Thermomicrobiales bacterium]
MTTTTTSPLLSPTRAAASGLPFVLDLGYLRARDLPAVGGKAANLGELISAGMPVPPGFAITTAAYDAIVAANDLTPLLEDAAATGDGAAARDAFAAAEIPEDIAAAILANYKALGGGSVAARSSATAEDLPGAAFAGQQDTVLGIRDEAALLKAVRQCWGSLWSDRAISYRQQRGFAVQPVALAVVVQRMVAADAAGVLFTANPITGDRNQTVIDASTGLGEAIVSGLVTPDHLILQRGRFGWKIIEHTTGDRAVEIREAAGGGVEHIIRSGPLAPAIPDRVAKDLARYGERIAAHFRAPQDIEWALAQGEIAILQARPITALPTPARRGPFGMPAGGPTEYFQMRPYPLDASAWTPAVVRAISRMVPLGKSAPDPTQMWHEEDGVVTQQREMAGKPSIDLALLPLRLIQLAFQHDPRVWRDDPDLHAALTDVRALGEADLAPLTWGELLAMVDAGLELPLRVVEMRRRYFPRTLLSMLGLRLLLQAIGRAGDFSALLSGIDNLTLQGNCELERIAATVRANPALAAALTGDVAQIPATLADIPGGPELLQELAAFLDANGHRELVSPLLVSQPVWHDSPEAVFGMLRGMAQTDAAPTHQTAAWQTTRDEILSLPDLQFPPLRWLFLKLLENARLFPSLREDTHFYLTTPLTPLRRIFAEMGRRLVATGALEDAADIYHLRYDELRALDGAWPPAPARREELRALVARRQAKRESLQHLPLLPPVAASTTAPPDDALAFGTPGSPGVATGPARLVHGPAEFGRIQPGDILVAPFTNPAWTPLFARAAGVIVDAGSAMSHAAIVAREYGLPAVMGTRDALTRLQDGQLVTVDGTRGLVFVAAGE